MTMTLTKSALIILGVLTLSGCSLFTPVKIEQPTQYSIDQIPTNIPRKPTHSAVLLVLMPEALPIYNTKQMAYTLRPHQISYFVKNQWAETPAEMLQPLIVQTLRNTHFFRAVVTPPYMGHYDYILSTQILKLKQDFTHCPATLQLRVSAQLTNTATTKIIAAREFSISQPMRHINPSDGVYAANQATVIMLEQLTKFTIKKTFK